MANPSINMPDEMQAEIDRRRPSTKSRAEYVREAIIARFEEEDSGTWSDVGEWEDDQEPVEDRSAKKGVSAENGR